MTDTALFPADLTIPIHSMLGVDRVRARRSDPETSHRAADSNNVRDSRAVVLHAFHERQNFADHELVQFLAATGYSDSRIRTARHDLTEDGLLELAGRTVSPTGRTARVFTLRKDAA